MNPLPRPLSIQPAFSAASPRTPGWPPSAHALAGGSVPADLAHQVQALGRHLAQCRHASRPWDRLGVVAEQVHRWAAPRVVTCLALAWLAIALASA